VTCPVIGRHCATERLSHGGWEGTYTLTCHDPDGDPVWLERSGSSVRCDVFPLVTRVSTAAASADRSVPCPDCTASSCAAPARPTPTAWSGSISRPTDGHLEALRQGLPRGADRTSTEISVPAVCAQ
jgi:hypothetical protein